jgi:branched-chain amino acid transport system ATP-binding protein
LATRQEAKKTLEYVFGLFPALKDLKNREGGFLSGGEQQMLAIGRALMAQPKLLLLDEPLMGLSPAMQSRLVQAIKEINSKTGITILITEQYAQPILPIVDHGYVMEKGTIVLAGTAKELTDNPHVKAAYLGA